MKKYMHSENNVPLEDVARLLHEINPKNLEALSALNELFTIADAWNNVDNFVPDFNNLEQQKWFPMFYYDDDDDEFVFMGTKYEKSSAPYCFGPRICFKTEERAEQFGKHFKGLFNKVFSINK